MAELVEFRRAGAADVDFLVETIFGAEKSLTDVLPYSRIFGIEEAALQPLLRSILLEDVAGQELCISGFLVACIDGVPRAACCGWVEGEGGVPSGLIKANVLHHFLSKEHLRNARQHFAALATLSIEREPGSIQIESLYVRPEARGRRVGPELMLRQIAHLRDRATVKKAQLIVAATNDVAVEAYRKIGWFTVFERSSDEPSLASLVPSCRKCLMELHWEKDR